MRKITNKAVQAFKEGKPFNSGNTTVSVNDGKVSFLLHGNKIAERSGNRLTVSNCGWHTATTVERLNAILWEYNLPRVNRTYKRDRGVYDEMTWINGKEFNSPVTYPLNDTGKIELLIKSYTENK